MPRAPLLRLLVLDVASFATLGRAQVQVATLPASADATVYDAPQLANGAGEHLFAGVTNNPEVGCAGSDNPAARSGRNGTWSAARAAATVRG